MEGGGDGEVEGGGDGEVEGGGGGEVEGGGDGEVEGGGGDGEAEGGGGDGEVEGGGGGHAGGGFGEGSGNSGEDGNGKGGSNDGGADGGDLDKGDGDNGAGECDGRSSRNVQATRSTVSSTGLMLSSQTLSQVAVSRHHPVDHTEKYRQESSASHLLWQLSQRTKSSAIGVSAQYERALVMRAAEQDLV